MQDKPTDFIDFIDLKGRATHFSIHGRNDKGVLFVSGNLEHGARIYPRTLNDANKLIQWLTEWKESYIEADKIINEVLAEEKN